MAKAELAAKMDLSDLNAYWPDWEDEETDERLFDIKDKLESLELYEKNILLLYAKYQSVRKVGSAIGISMGLVSREINKIKRKLYGQK